MPLEPERAALSTGTGAEHWVGAGAEDWAGAESKWDERKTSGYCLGNKV